MAVESTRIRPAFDAATGRIQPRSTAPLHLFHLGTWHFSPTVRHGGGAYGSPPIVALYSSYFGSAKLVVVRSSKHLQVKGVVLVEGVHLVCADLRVCAGLRDEVQGASSGSSTMRREGESALLSCKHVIVIREPDPPSAHLRESGALRGPDEHP